MGHSRDDAIMKDLIKWKCIVRIGWRVWYLFIIAPHTKTIDLCHTNVPLNSISVVNHEEITQWQYKGKLPDFCCRNRPNYQQLIGLYLTFSQDQEAFRWQFVHIIEYEHFFRTGALYLFPSSEDKSSQPRMKLTIISRTLHSVKKEWFVA